MSSFKHGYNPDNVLIGPDGYQEWNNESGTNVQRFIKGELEKSIQSLEFEDTHLIGKNAFGDEVANVEVTVAEPTYAFEGIDAKVFIGTSNTALTSVTYDINANADLRVRLLLNWNLTQTITKKLEYMPLAVDYRVYLVTAGTLTKHKTNASELMGKINYSASGAELDVSALFDKEEIESDTVLIKVELSYTTKSGDYAGIDTTTYTRLNVTRITLNYPKNAGLLRTPYLNFEITGLDISDDTDFNLKLSAVVKNGTSYSVITTTKQLTSTSVQVDLTQINNLLSGDVCPVNVCARIENSSKTLYSDYIIVSALYQSPSVVEDQVGGSVAISYVPDKINNCDSANLFNVVTTDKMTGTVTVYVYKDTSKSTLVTLNVSNPSSNNYYKGPLMMSKLLKQVTINLSGAEETDTKEFFSYTEIANLNEGNNKIYLAFVIQNGEDNSSAEISNFCVPMASSATREAVREVTIVNPKNSSELMHVASGKIIDYSQITTTKTFNLNGVYKPLFAEDNLHDNIDSTDGVTQDDMYMGFKVSPLGVEARNANSYEAANPAYEPTPALVPINLFKNPVPLRNEAQVYLPNTSEFSIELLIKTYNVNNDDDFILSMGNLRLYPHYLRIWEPKLGHSEKGDLDFSSYYIASCANFAKDEVTHIMITYNSNYKPDLYDLTVYNDLYNNYNRESSSGGPNPIKCLKIYINGVINRSIQIDHNWLLDSNKKFDLQIHPSNSNINIYGFRTYNKCLSYNEIIQNRISAFASLEDEKLPFLKVNDLIYKASDYSAQRWREITNAGLANTISIKKCLNIPDTGYVINKQYPQKNVMLIVTGDEGPLYFGNKKIPSKYHDAAMFIKYAPVIKNAKYDELYNGKFIGQKLVGEDGYDAYYKAQGTSAKKYGGAYNVQFSKFWFIPEFKLNEFSETIAEDGSNVESIKDSCKIKDSYDIPGEPSIGITKLVGKVNYASSMQSHKQGACNLYAECYPDRASDYMKRRAVKEDVFYYFYIKLSDCVKAPSQEKEVTFRNVTWDNIDFDKVRFFGIQTWGSAKMDKATFGLESKKDLEYICIEGADNKNANTNFKSPWAAMQIWKDFQPKKNPYYSTIKGKADPNEYVNQFSGKNGDDPDYITGLLIDDETIRYKAPSAAELSDGDDAIEKGPDAWDIAGNAIEEKPSEGVGENKVEYSKYYQFKTWGQNFINTSGEQRHAIQPAKDSLSKFAEFSNMIYTFDFGNLDLFGSTEEGTNQALKKDGGYDEAKKYIITYTGSVETDKGTYNVNAGDVFRWDQLFKTFVPAGLYHNGTTWETFNVGDEYKKFTSVIFNTDSGRYPLYRNMYDAAVQNFNNYNVNDYEGGFEKPVSLLTKEGDNEAALFYTDDLVIDSIISNLWIDDNRENALMELKRAYADIFKCVIWAYCDVNSFAYHQAAARFLSGTDNRAKNIYFVIKGNSYKVIDTESIQGNPEKKGKYYVINNAISYKNRHLITLFLDDLDTIFATDNNGQQSKDYNLLEPIYNNETMDNWGDSRSGLWYNFDLLFEAQIKHHLARIVDWAIRVEGVGNGKVYDTRNNLYKNFFVIQNEIIPPVTYNHTSEIYYDAMQMIFASGDRTPYGKTLDSFSSFNNNLVKDPMSLVHGGCFESEKQFLKKRVALLASYSTSFESEDTFSTIKPEAATYGGSTLTEYMRMTGLSFIQDFYPNIVNNKIYDVEQRSYADPIVIAYNPPEYLTALSRQDDKYDIARFELSSTLTDRDVVGHTDYFKTVTFREGVSNVSAFAMNNVSELRYVEPDYKDKNNEDIHLSDGQKGIKFPPINTDITTSSMYMDKVIKNVEILDAPYSKFTKATIDFSGCQRLKELDLSYATSTTGISRIILPKSNKLRRVTLPSAVKRVTIEYYPGITNFEVDTTLPIDQQTWLKFDTPAVGLESIIIDYRNSWALDFLEKYAIKGTIQNIVLENVDPEITIKASLLNVLASLDSFDFTSKVKLNIEGDVDMNLKALLAKKWGNVDLSTNKVYCVYDVIYGDHIDYDSTNTTIEKTGNFIAFNVLSEDNKNANNIQISGNRLNVQYSLTDKDANCSEASVDINTGEFTVPASVKSGSKAKLTIKVTLNNAGGGTSDKTSVPIEVSFGAFIPEVGDIVYSDGSISRALNLNKTPVGFIFWKHMISSDSNTKLATYDYRVMAFESLRKVTERDSSDGLPFGPSNLFGATALYYPEGMSSTTQGALMGGVFQGTQWYGNYVQNDDKNSQHFVGGATGDWKYTSKVQATSAIPSEDSQNLYCGEYTTKVIRDFVYTQNSGQNAIMQRIKAKYTTLSNDALQLDESTYDTRYNLLKSEYTNMERALFPAFVKTYEWVPTGVDPNDENIGKYHWYIPSNVEYSYLIKEKLKQSYSGRIAGEDVSTQWKNAGTVFYDESTGLLRNVEGYNDNVFRKLLTNMGATSVSNFSSVNIDFISQNLSFLKSSTFANISASGDANNNVYVYTDLQDYSGNQYVPDWTAAYSGDYWGSTGSPYVVMTTKAIVYPCCRIIKTLPTA